MSAMRLLSGNAGKRRCLTVVAALAMMFATVLLAAQENGGSPPVEKQSAGAAAQSSSTEATIHAAGRESAKPEETAKPEDENAQFKQSFMVKLMAKKLHITVDHAYWLGIITNFAIVVGALIFFLRKKFPVAGGVSAWARGRTATIQKGMEDARRASEDANRRLSEIEERLGRLDTEIAQLQATAARQGDEDEARQKAAAEEERHRMIEAAEQEISAAANTARRELKAYSAELAVSLAEKRIKVDAATDQELVRDFVDQLGRDGRQ
jgi:F-type H+-transporting ATPase subunit b